MRCPSTSSTRLIPVIASSAVGSVSAQATIPPERIDFRAGADDGVIVRIDGEVVLERHPAVGMHTEMRSVALEAGAHALQIDHWQRGAARRLNVQSSPAGGEPEPIRPGRLFPADPGALGYWLRVAAVQLAWPVLLVWAAGPATWLGRKVWRGAAALTAREVGARLRVVTLPAFLGPAQVLLFGPWTVHATNRAEFLAPFWSLAPRWIGLLGLVTGLLVAIGLLLPPRGFRRYAAGLCAAGVLLWAQGNLLVVDYGLLDGGGLDLTPPAGRVPFEAALWIGVLAIALGFAGAVSRAAPTASALLVGLQAVVLLLPPLAPAAPRPESGGAAESWRLPPAAIYELSADRNLIHIVLDMFPSHIFAEIRDGDRPAFDRGWSGFTFFREHLGAFRTTLGSMPAMLTGVPWRNEMRFDRYARRHPSVFHALGRHGYRLRSLTAYSPDHPSDRFPGAEGAVRYTIPSPYGSYRDYVDSASAQLLDLSLFRHAPHGVKARIYRDDRGLFQQWIEARRGAVATAWRSFGDTVFLQEFTSRITAAGDAPVYSFLHLITPHPPISTDAECVYPGRRLRLTRAGYLAQAQCALRVVRTLLDRLRDLGLYDRSAIIVTSDHGLALFPAADHPLRGIGSPAGRSLRAIESDATPLLLIKPFGAQGPLQTSDAPTAITDLPATLLDLAGLPNTLETGTSALALDPARPRERTYAYHSWGGRNTHTSRWFDVLHLFSVDGRVDRPGGVALPEGNLRAGGRSCRPTRGASHRSLGGRGRGGAGRRPPHLRERRVRGLLRSRRHRARYLRRPQGAGPRGADGDGAGRRPGRRPAVAHRRRVAHARLRGRGARCGQQPALRRAAGQPGVADGRRQPPRRPAAGRPLNDAPHAARRRGDSPPCLPESFRPSGSRGWCGPVSIRNFDPLPDGLVFLRHRGLERFSKSSSTR